MSDLTLTIKLTDVGMAAVAAAHGMGLQAKITHVAVGDQGHVPNAAATALHHELARVPLTAGGPVAPKQVLLQGLIEPGGTEFFIRECGFFLEDGTLLGVWSDPAVPLGWCGGATPWFFKLSFAWSELPAESITVIIADDAGQAGMALDLSRLEAKVRHTVETGGGAAWADADDTQLTAAIITMIAKPQPLRPLPTGVSLEIGTAHQGMVIVATASIQLVLPDTATVGYGWGVDVVARDGAVVLNPLIADKINGGVNGGRYVVPRGTSAQVISDGAGDWYVLHDRTVLRGILTGLTTSRVDGTTIAVAAGQAADSTAGYLMSLAGTTKVLQAAGAWSAGIGGNGIMSPGGRAVGTWYHVHLIRKDADGTTDIGLDTSPVAANRPDGWTAYRRIGGVKTSDYNTVIPFAQAGDRYMWTSSVSDVIGAAVGATRMPVALSVPTGIQTTALLRVSMTAAAAGTFAALSATTEDDQVAGVTYASLVVPTAGTLAAGTIEIPTNTAGQIAVRASAAASLSIGTYGWIDTRGRWE